MSNTWFNEDGLVQRYGGYHTNPANRVNRAGELRSVGEKKILEIDLDLIRIANTAVTYTTDRDNDGANDGFNTGDPYLPAGAVIESAKVYMSEAAAGGTSIAVGTYQLDGTAIDADGFITTTNGAAANMAAIGAVVTGSGADIGTTHSTTLDGYIAVVGAGTWTAGKGRLVITYIDTLADS